MEGSAEKNGAAKTMPVEDAPLRPPGDAGADVEATGRARGSWIALAKWSETFRGFVFLLLIRLLSPPGIPLPDLQIKEAAASETVSFHSLPSKGDKFGDERRGGERRAIPRSNSLSRTTSQNSFEQSVCLFPFFFFGKESGITVKLGHFLRINESEIFTSFLHLAVGEEKDEAVDGKEGTSNDDLPNPARIAWEGINGNITTTRPSPVTEMMTPTVTTPINTQPRLRGKEVDLPPALQSPSMVFLGMAMGVNGRPDCDKISGSRWMGLQIR